MSSGLSASPASELAGLCTWLISLLDDELSALEQQDAERAMELQTQFDAGMERVRQRLLDQPELLAQTAASLRLLNEAIDAHAAELTSVRESYGRELGSIRAQAQIASYAPLRLDGVPTPRYYDRAG